MVHWAYADLKGACFPFMDLKYADLSGANLSGACFNYADLRYADLRRANLSGASLRRACLDYADLRGAILIGTDLEGAILEEANLDEDFRYPFVCPEKGSFIGWKCALNIDGNRLIVKLEIPEDAKRLSGTSRKCRCDKAKVLSITDEQNKKECRIARSICDSNFLYEVGQMVSVDDYDEDRWRECSRGIHFFMTKEEAMNYFF